MFSVRSLFAVRGVWSMLRERPRGEYARGLEALHAGRFDEAEAALLRALDETPDDRTRALVHNKRGVVFVAVGRREAALDAFAQALACDPTCAAALTSVGNLLLEDGDAEDAIDYYEAAIECDDGYPLAHRNLGIALRRVGRRDASVRALRKADRLAARRPRGPA